MEDGSVTTTVNRMYDIDEIMYSTEKIRIIDDFGHMHYFSFSYYKKWFHLGLKEMRKRKLKKIFKKHKYYV